MRTHLTKSLFVIVLMAAALGAFASIALAQSETEGGLGASVETAGQGEDPGASTGAALADALVNSNPLNPIGLVKQVSGAAGDGLGYVAELILSGVASLILTFANLLLAIAGTLFNWTMIYTVFEFSNLVGNSPGLLAGWGILRDLGNMLLLFGFIFIGLATILELQTYSVKKALPRLIIFAILMNFSLFAAEAVIDTSNVLTASLYEQIGCTDIPDTVGAEGSRACDIDHGVSAKIMESTGLASIYDAGPAIAGKPEILIGLALFATIGAVVLFAGSILLIIRAVVLTFLMLMAPIGFAALAIPAFERAGRDWWTRLIHQSFFAPIYLLLLLISLKIAEGFAEAGSNSSLAGALTREGQQTEFMGVFFVFAIVIGFLIASLVAAKKFGAMGATLAVNMGTKFTMGGIARGTNLVVGGGAYGIQRGIERGLVHTSKDSARYKIGSFVVSRGLSPLVNANLDPRRIAGPGLKLMGATEGAKPAEHITFGELKHRYQELRDDKRGREKSAKFDREVDTRRLVNELHIGAGLSPESERLLAGLSADEIASNHDLQHSIENLAEHLNPEQFEGMMKSDELTSQTKRELTNARFHNAEVAIAGGYAQRDTIRNLSNKDLQMMAKYAPETFNDLLLISDPATGDSMLSNDQNEALGKSDALTNGQRERVRAQTKGGRIETAVSAGVAVPPGILRAMNSKMKAKLSASALTNPDVIDSYTQGDLAEIQREAKLSPPQVHIIAARIRDPRHPNHHIIDPWLRGKPDANGYWR